MNSRVHEAIAKRFNEDDQIDRLIRQAVKKALRKHFSNGERVVVWRNGQAVWVSEGELNASS